MAWNDIPETPVPDPHGAASRPAAPVAGRRIVTAALAALLLVGGGVAAASAASPEPSGSATPTRTADPGATQQPSDDGTDRSDESRPKGDCPEGERGSARDDGTTDDGSAGGSSSPSEDGGASDSDA